MSEALDLLVENAKAYATAFLAVRGALIDQGMEQEEAELEARSTVTTAMLIPDESLLLEGLGLSSCPLCGKESYS